MNRSCSKWPRSLVAITAVAIALASAASADEPRQQSAAGLIASLQPSVVNVLIIRHKKTAASTANIAAQDTTAETTVQSSGFFIDPMGVILTNRHVVTDASDIIVMLHDSSQLRASIMATDTTDDIALLKVNAGGPVPFLRFGNSDLLRPGDPVFIMGNPLGFGSTVTAGIVSALDRNTPDSEAASFIQIDAALNVGNSGGPVFNQAGEVVGVSTALATPGNQSGSVGLGLAIPGNDAHFIMDRLMAFGQVRLGWIGIHVQPVTADIATALHLPTVAGSIITRIDADSPAAHAQLAGGDVIVRVDGNDMPGPRALNRKIASLAEGSASHITLWRAGIQLTSSVTIGALPSDNAAPTRKGSNLLANSHIDRSDLGLSLAPLTDDARARLGMDAEQAGALVQGVATNSTAWERGITLRSAILMVDGQAVTSPADVLRMIEEAEKSKREFVLLLVEGSRGLYWIPLPLKPT
jgi:serine protease Do